MLEVKGELELRTQTSELFQIVRFGANWRWELWPQPEKGTAVQKMVPAALPRKIQFHCTTKPKLSFGVKSRLGLCSSTDGNDVTCFMTYF